MALRIRRGTDAERLTITPLQGEIIFATDTKKLYVGDGATVGGVLIGPVDATDFDLINDTTPQLGGNLDLNGNNITGTGNININGTITATGNIGLGDSGDDTIEVGGLINSSLRPALSDTYDLGSASRRWNELFAEGVYIDGEARVGSLRVAETIEGSDSSVIYDAGTDSLSVTSVTAAKVYADVLGSVFSDDSSTVLVDSVAGEVVGNVNTGRLVVTKDTGINAADLVDINGIQGGDLPFVNVNIAKGSQASLTDLDPGDDIGGYRLNAYADGSYKTVMAILSVLASDADITTDNPKTNTYFVVGNNSAQTFFTFGGNGVFNAPTALQTGTYADEAARDAAIPSPAAGMIVLITGRDDSTGSPTFQGYDGTDWRDLST
jgi:hypothetical protein